MTRRYTPVIDHIVQGLSRVPEQYRGSPKFLTLCAIFLRQVELIHEALEAIPAAFCLDDAVGWRLDWVGSLVGQKRKGSNDDVFRTWIRAKIRANRSIGKNEDVRAVAGLVLADYTYKAHNDAICVYTQDVLTQEMAHAIVTILQSAAPCVQVQLYYNTLPVFTRHAATTQPTDDYGYSTVGGTEGGAYTALVVSDDPC